MKKYFRWQGIVGFLVTTALVLALLMLLLPSLIKIGIEQSGRWYLGAEVNVSNVDVGYSPFAITVEGFQATDNAKPSHNVVQFERATAGVDIWQYLFGKVLIDELAISGVKLDRERQSPGEVFRDENTSLTEATGESISKQLPAIENSLPNVEDILNDSDLLSVKASKQLEQSYKVEKAKLKKLKSEIPSKQTLKNYEAEVKKLTKTKIKSLEDISALEKKLSALKKKFKKDKATVKRAKTQFENSKDILAKAVKDTKEAPTKDWNNLKTKYQLDKVDNADFAHILFGEKARGYYQSAEKLYLKVKPLIESSKADKEQKSKLAAEAKAHGRFIHFKDDNPLPPWLVKQASFDIELETGTFAFQLSEVTAEHWHRNKPTIVNASSDNLLKGGSGKLTSEIFNNNEEIFTKGNWQFTGLPVSKAKIRNKPNLTLNLDSAAITGVGQFSTLDQELISVSEFSIEQTKFVGSSDSSVGRSLVDVMASIDSFSLAANIGGEITSPNMSISSDLDNLINKAISQQLKKKLNQFQSKLQKGLNDKVAKALKISNNDVAEIADVEALLENTDQAINKLLSSDVVKKKKKEFEDKKKKELEDKLKKKLGKLIG